MAGVIYCLTSRTSGKSYVGQTVVSLRKQYGLSTKQAVRRSHSILKRAISKYGWDDFDQTIVEKCPSCGLNDAEQFWIVYLQTRAPSGYNIGEGGDSSRLGCKITDEHKRKIGDANRGREYPAEVLARMSAGQKRRFRDPAEREKLSGSNRGKPSPKRGCKLSAEHRRKMSEAHRGKPLSAKHRQKIGDAHRGRPGRKWSEEDKRKSSEARRGKPGRPHTAEARKRMSEIAKQREAKKRAARERSPCQ